MDKADIQSKLSKINICTAEMKAQGIDTCFILKDKNGQMFVQGTHAIGKCVILDYESIRSELSNITEYNWIDRIMIPKLQEPLDANSRDQLKSHLSKIIIAEQNLGKAHVEYNNQNPSWWDESITFARKNSITGLMKKKDLVIQVQNAYTHYNLKNMDTKFVHIEWSDFPGPPIIPSKINHPIIQQTPVLFPQPAPIMSTSIQPQQQFWINESLHPVVVDKVIKDFLEEAYQNNALLHNDSDSICHHDAAKTQKQLEIDWPLKKIRGNEYSLKGINYAFIDSLDVGINVIRLSNAKLNKSMEVNFNISTFPSHNTCDHAKSISPSKRKSTKNLKFLFGSRSMSINTSITWVILSC